MRNVYGQVGETVSDIEIKGRTREGETVYSHHLLDANGKAK